MDLARQKEIVEIEVSDFNSMISETDYTLNIEWFVYDGDRWKIKRSDGVVLADYLTFDQAILIIRALIFYKR